MRCGLGRTMRANRARAVALAAAAAAAASAALGAAGCEADGGAVTGREGFEVVDSAGVRIALNLWAGEEEMPEWRLAEEPTLSVGDPSPSPEYELHQVSSARTFPDGRVAVTLGQREVRIYGPEGDHLRTIARFGEGPGEFSHAWDAIPLGDTAVQVVDQRQQRMLVYDAATGSYLGGRAHGIVFTGNPVMPLSDGSVVGLQNTDPASRSARALVRVGAAGSTVDTLAMLAADISDDTFTMLYFNPNFASAAVGESVWAGWGDELEIARYAADGRVEQIVRSTMPGEPVTQELRDDAPTELPDGYRLELPDRLPLFGRLAGTPAGWLWVRRYMSNVEQRRSETRIWDIYDPEGRQAAFIRVPLDSRIYEIGDDYLLGVFLTDLEIETVRRYPLVKPGGG